MHNGEFSPTSYDLITRNCNNFSDAAAKSLRLPKAVPQWILDLPQKFMSSPLGMMMRPMLEQMQMTTVAPTNIGNNGSMRGIVPQQQPAPMLTATANPWANISSTTATPTTQPTKSKGTPLLDKQTALLSTDVGVVKICIDKLKPDEEQTKLLSKLADTNAQWTGTEISSVHKYLQSVITNNQLTSYALMLLRLVVLKGGDAATESTKLVASLIIDGKLKSSAISMAWCVLSNAMGSNNPPNFDLAPIIDQALSDCDCSKDKALRQSSAAFIYNVSRCLTKEASSDGELSEGDMSILLGALENLQEEPDAETAKRLYMATGQILKSNASAVSLVNELGLMDGEIARGKMKEVESLASEVASLCS